MSVLDVPATLPQKYWYHWPDTIAHSIQKWAHNVHNEKAKICTIQPNKESMLYFFTFSSKATVQVFQVRPICVCVATKDCLSSFKYSTAALARGLDQSLSRKAEIISSFCKGNNLAQGIPHTLDQGTESSTVPDTGVESSQKQELEASMTPRLEREKAKIELTRTQQLG